MPIKSHGIYIACLNTDSLCRLLSAQWREWSARRYVFKGLNEQLRQDVQSTMTYVGRSVEASESRALDAVVAASETRVEVFR